MNRAFAAIGRSVVRHRWAVLAAWTGLLVLGIVFAPRLQEVFEREFVTSNTGDSQAGDIIDAVEQVETPARLEAYVTGQ